MQNNSSHRIRHFFVDRPVKLTHFLCTQIGLTNVEAENLIELGAVYINKFRTKTNVDLNIGEYLRIHTEPRRFPLTNFNFKTAVIAETENWIALNKPWGLPVHATLDNDRENLLSLLKDHINPVFHTHRLDIGTQGILLFARSEKWQQFLNHLFHNGQITKRYRAWTVGPPPTGLIVSHMEPNRRAPKILSPVSQQGWKRSETKILLTEPSVDIYGYKTYMSTIELITGRTHQIRAQLAALNCPILGDHLYGGETVANVNGEWIALQCAELKWRDPTKEKEISISLNEKDFNFPIK